MPGRQGSAGQDVGPRETLCRMFRPKPHHPDWGLRGGRVDSCRVGRDVAVERVCWGGSRSIATPSLAQVQVRVTVRAACSVATSRGVGQVVLAREGSAVQCLVGLLAYFVLDP